MKQAWVTVTSREYEPLCRVMVRSLLPVTTRPIIVNGVDYLPDIPGTIGRTLGSGPENLGFGRMRAIAETLRQYDLATTIQADSDILFVRRPTCSGTSLPPHIRSCPGIATVIYTTCWMPFRGKSV